MWPVVVQDFNTGQVLMLAYANQAALDASRATGRAHFWSRSRRELWDKGSTSGQVLPLVDISFDCDEDAVLYRVRAPKGACHTGQMSCFGNKGVAFGPLGKLWATQSDRLKSPSAVPSYTRALFESGLDRILRKVGEESAEFMVACKNQDPREITAEVSDLIYHVWLALHASGVTLDEVGKELERRSATR